MIKSFRFENFKSFEGVQELTVDDLTTIIGLNSSGKTNIIEGISILTKVVSGIDITAFFNNYSNNQEDSVRGGASGCCRSRKKIFGLGCTINKDTRSDLIYSIKLDVSNEDRVYISEENLYEFDTHENKKTLIFKTIIMDRHKGDILVEYNNKKKGKNPRVLVERNKSIISQLNKEMLYAKSALMDMEEIISKAKDDYVNLKKLEDIQSSESKTIYDDIKRFLDSVKNIYFLDPSPERMRGYVRKENSRLRKDASNISAVLDYMYSEFQMVERRINRENKITEDKKTTVDDFTKEKRVLLKRQSQLSKKWADLLEIIKVLPEYNLEDIEILVTPAPLRDVIFTCLEKIDGKNIKIPANLLSDGTLRVIGIATALITYPENSVLIIDEFDSGIHHSKAFYFLEKINEIAKDRNITLIITTHNSALLNSYKGKLLEGVSVVYRDKEDGNSRIKMFIELYDTERLLAMGGLGDASLKDGLEDYLYPRSEKIKLPSWLMGESK